jgi:hypothetical protein
MFVGFAPLAGITGRPDVVVSVDGSPGGIGQKRAEFRPHARRQLWVDG